MEGHLKIELDNHFNLSLRQCYREGLENEENCCMLNFFELIICSFNGVKICSSLTHVLQALQLLLASSYIVEVMVL
jgi:hypothetical protein